MRQTSTLDGAKLVQRWLEGEKKTKTAEIAELRQQMVGLLCITPVLTIIIAWGTWALTFDVCCSQKRARYKNKSRL